MKSLYQLPLLAACVMQAEAVTALDSGWLTELPTVRATAAAVDSVAELSGKLHGWNRYAAIAAEVPLAYHFLTWQHELGHADRARAQGGSWSFAGTTANAWAFLGRSMYGAFTTWEGVQGSQTLIMGAGFNATALWAAESDASLIWTTYARLSTVFYDPSRELSDLACLCPAYDRSFDLMRGLQIATAVLSYFTPVNADVLFGRDDLQLRAGYTFKGWRATLESPLGEFRPEITLRRSWGHGTYTLVIGRAIAGSVEVQHGRWSLGAAYHDSKTYNGERLARGERSTEAYAKIKF